MIDALLFNLNENKRLLNIFDTYNLKYLEIDKNKYNQSFINILNNKSNYNLCLTTFKDSMLVFNNVDDKVLDLLLLEFKRNNLSIPLKAVLTSNNINWTPLFLYDQLKKEALFYR